MTLGNLIEHAPDLEQYQNGVVKRTTIDEPWGQIVHFSSPDLPPFPTDIFPDWLHAFVESVAESTQTPPDLAGMLALSVLATCAQRWVMIKGNENWLEPVNVFTVTALPPASRKSAVFRAFVAPLLAYEQRLTHEARQRIAETAARKDIVEQRLEAAKREAAKATRGPDIDAAMEKVDDLTHELANLVVPPAPRLIVDDVTPEALSTLLVEQGGRMAALSPEGDVFAIMAGRYTNGGPNFGVFLKAHAGDTLRVDRRSRSEFVDWPALTLGITTQPDVVRGLAEKAGFRGQGLLGRFLYALPESLVGRRLIDPPVMAEEVRTTYHEHIATLLQWREGILANCANTANQNQSANTAKESLIDDLANIYILKISTAGSILLHDFLAWLEPHLAPSAAFGAFADWAGKLAGAALRVAALLHVARVASSQYSHNSQNEIDAETLADALRFAHYAAAHARAAFSEMGADPAISGARRALQWIERRALREFTKRDLFEAIKGTVPKADDMEPILKTLCDHGYIRAIEQERIGPGRRPSQRYEVHPAVATGVHSQYSHNSHIPPFTFDLPVREAGVNGADIEVDMASVRLALAKGQEQSVRQQLQAHGYNPDAIIARARAVPGYRAVEGFDG